MVFFCFHPFFFWFSPNEFIQHVYLAQRQRKKDDFIPLPIKIQIHKLVTTKIWESKKEQKAKINSDGFYRLIAVVILFYSDKERLWVIKQASKQERETSVSFPLSPSPRPTRSTEHLLKLISKPSVEAIRQYPPLLTIETALREAMSLPHNASPWRSWVAAAPGWALTVGDLRLRFPKLFARVRGGRAGCGRDMVRGPWV